MRYYYTDPLAAEWMSDKFGMKFISAEGIDSYFDEMGLFCETGTFGRTIDKIYIHPDSLHLLEPWAGDLIEYTLGGKPLENHHPVYWGENSYDNHNEKRIIQRNGKAFMWPEVGF